MSELTVKWVCPSCGYDGFRTNGGPRCSIPTVTVSAIWGCPNPECNGTLVRDDALGQLEHELSPLTKGDLLERADMRFPDITLPPRKDTDPGDDPPAV